MPAPGQALKDFPADFPVLLCFEDVVPEAPRGLHGSSALQASHSWHPDKDHLDPLLQSRAVILLFLLPLHHLTVTAVTDNLHIHFPIQAQLQARKKERAGWHHLLRGRRACISPLTTERIQAMDFYVVKGRRKEFLG